MTNALSALRPCHYCVLAFFFVAAVGSNAVAQEAKTGDGEGVPLHRKTSQCQGITLEATAYEKFVESYYGLEKGSWQSFQDSAARIIGGLVCERSLLRSPASDPWYFVLFPEIRVLPGSEVRQITYRRAVVHSAPSPAFQSTRIVYGKLIVLYDVHITPEKEAPVDTEYTATPVGDPVIGGIKKALGLVVANWQNAIPFGVKSQSADVKAPPEEIAFAVSVTKIELPFGLDRASITLKDATRASSAPASRTSTAMSSSGDHSAKKVVVEDLTADEVSVPGSSAYYLAPLTKFEIGLGAGYVTRTALNQAAKVDSSMKLVDATPTTLLSYVAANWRPWGYDESDRRASFRQDFRIVIGPALTPDPGFVFGLGYAPAASLRPLSIQAGFGILLSDVLRSGDTLGNLPQDSAHPTKRGGLGVWFIGLGYGLQ